MIITRLDVRKWRFNPSLVPMPTPLLFFALRLVWSRKRKSAENWEGMGTPITWMKSGVREVNVEGVASAKCEAQAQILDMLQTWQSNLNLSQSQWEGRNKDEKIKGMTITRLDLRKWHFYPSLVSRPPPSLFLRKKKYRGEKKATVSQGGTGTRDLANGLLCSNQLSSVRFVSLRGHSKFISSFSRTHVLVL